MFGYCDYRVGWGLDSHGDLVRNFCGRSADLSLDDMEYCDDHFPTGVAVTATWLKDMGLL